jgi:hypothetical protein
MKLPDKRTALLMLFAVLFLVSLITTYMVHRLPTQETITETLCSYSSNAKYDYVAMLKPNIINNNRTVLRPGEDTLYTGLTKQINMTLDYTFQTTLPATVETTYNIHQNLKTTAWQYTIDTTTQSTTNQRQIKIRFLPYNMTELELLKEKIEAEAGTSSSTYSIEIDPTFIVNANTSAGAIHQSFRPALTIDVSNNRFSSDQGNIIIIDNLTQIEAGSITMDRVSVHNEVIIEQYASYVFMAVSAVGLGLFIYRYRTTIKRTGKSRIDDIISPHKNLIIETKEIPQNPQGIMIIDVENLEELAKTAEILLKPILHAPNDNEHLFYMIDGNVRYQYKIPKKLEQ